MTPAQKITFKSDFFIGQRVYIDGDHSIKATVTGIMFRFDGISVEVGWFVAGNSYSIWMPEFRLSK